ncbi:hypothetical protein EJ08DRAFT_644618 [Tothia fuscella]|uniref:Uncharacterized protein n=1 Tax=Tothia fuscella TaxID=1048955 RepID=A0A9P4P5F2_9PEZI|nr:hypothetical protein EJ08DRAFT_644618 [Tothia fuscella]
MAGIVAQDVKVGESLGFFALGSSLHYVLTRLKAEPTVYPKIHLVYSPTEPLLNPIIILVPTNGLRLNFDSIDQRLRYVEILDFSRTKITYSGQEVVKFPENHEGVGAGFGGLEIVLGPSFKHVYKLFGGTTPGEFFGDDGGEGKYCLSYPGIAFLFPLASPIGFSNLDWASTVSVLSSSACGPASSMVLYDGSSWHSARRDIFTAEVNFPRVPLSSSRKDGIPAEIELAKVHDQGRVELIRKDAHPFWIILSTTTPQDLITELGPPDSTYKKTNRQTSAHHGHGHRRASSSSSRRSSDVTDVDGHSMSSATDASDNSAWEDEDDDDTETKTVANDIDKDNVGVWWNYYSHGLDILISQPTVISTKSPTAPPEKKEKKDGEQPSLTNGAKIEEVSNDQDADDDDGTIVRNHLTATKIIIHSNIPGSYQFNRHRRLRWSMDAWPGPSTSVDNTISVEQHIREDLIPTDESLDADPPSSDIPPDPSTLPLTSETCFPLIQARLKSVFAPTYESEEDEREQQQPMAINRDWGEASSLGGSVELLGGWEEGKRKDGSVIGVSGGGTEADKIGEVLMFGFPGMAFEVLKNDVVGVLQIW